MSSELVETDSLATDLDATASRSHGDSENRERWRAVVDRPLIEWGRDSARFSDADEAIESPSPSAITMAANIAASLGESSVPAPLRVVMNGDGGITFEWRFGSGFWTLDVDSDGGVQFCRFEDCRLVESQRIL